ncbi:DUF6758 family protein [Actinorugispora endophytica]|uniref:Uncharacterized protein n=1 Tax=Actinorugispora endophytica TaxID=1605990 RepID=A0A4R6V3A1_9ACTN|nr:DUF6758 family protein [Actinorugispora endophytica]TDQ54741.1 hypothetical protein EV190_10157 [Actinorugispora endophytica]
MKTVPTCPRCGRAVHEPNLWSSAWQCDAHGPVAPLRGVRSPATASLEILAKSAKVPIWIPWPLPVGWVVTGFADAGDDRSGELAIAVALSGPAPLGGVGEMVIVAEDPGIGLATRIARLDGPDPGDGFDQGQPDARVRHDGHEIHLWSVDGGKERAVYVGEALASWLWIILQPADTGLLMCEINAVRDLRDDGLGFEPPFGAPSPFLSEALRVPD